MNRFSLLMVLISVPIMGLYAQKNIKPDRPIALAQGVVDKELTNGLRYIIKENDMPGHKVEFRLIIKAGAIFETPQQRGCAHFLEHMAFNGTKNYPGGGIVQYLESLGVNYGFGINAVTGFDRTVYMFSMPTDRPADLDSGLMILRDWLCNITLDPAEVELEKGIVLEESRQYDLGDVFYDLKIGDGRYKDRMPLGSTEQIKAMSTQSLKQFYKTWYTTQLATVVVVGDLNKEDMEKRVKNIFGNVPRSTSPDYKEYPLEYTKRLSYTEHKDSLVSTEKLEIIFPHKSTYQKTYLDLLTKQRESILISALNERSRSLASKASISNEWYLSDKDHLVIEVEGRNRDFIKSVTEKASTLFTQALKYGFSSEELIPLKNKQIERLRNEKFIKPSDQWCEDFTDLVLSGERYLNDTTQHKWIVDNINATSSKDLQSILKRWINNYPTMLVAYTFNPTTSNGLTADEIEKIWKYGASKPCEPYVYVIKESQEDPFINLPVCLTKPIEPANNLIKQTVTLKDLNITDIHLINGARVILRPTKSEDKTMSITAFAPGGLSLLNKDNYYLLEGTAGYMEMGGLAKMNYEQYGPMLMQEELAISMNLEQYWHGFVAQGSSEKPDVLFNMIYEKCCFPEKRYEDFKISQEELIAGLGKETVLSKMLKNDPQRMITARLDKLMGNSITNGSEPQTKEQVEALNLDKMSDFYIKLFSNPKDMTYIVCGNFELKEVADKIIGMIARLTPNQEPIKIVDSGFKFPTGIVMEQFPNENKGQTIVDYLFFGNYTPSLRNSLILKMTRDIVRNRLLKVLREEESLTYSPYISMVYKGNPDATYYFDIGGSFDTNNTAKADSIIKSILTDLKVNPVGNDEIESLRRLFIVTKREALNEYATAQWTKTITSLIRDGESLADMDQYQSVLYSITAEDLQISCKKVFDLNNYVLLHMGDHQLNKK